MMVFELLLVLWLCNIMSSYVILETSDTIFTLNVKTTYSLSVNSTSSEIQYFQVFIPEPKDVMISITPDTKTEIILYLDISTRVGYNLKPSETNCLEAFTRQISTLTKSNFEVSISESGSLAIGLKHKGINRFEIEITLNPYTSPEKTSEVMIAVFLTVTSVAVILIIIGALYIRKKKKMKNSRNESSTNPNHLSGNGGNVQIPQTEDILHQLNQNDMNVAEGNESVHANNILVHDYQGSMTRMHNMEDEFENTMPTIPNERTREDSVELCVICLVANKDILFEPCNHVATCQECALKVLEIQSKCPLCREEIVSILPVA